MISIDKVYSQLEKQTAYISVVELAMILEANTSEVRQRLNELGDRVVHNEHDEWRVVGEVVQRLELSPLSASEIEERNELENTVQQAFLLAGHALKTLRDKRLYRQTHNSFVTYVKERFDFTRRAADYLISASEVFDNLKREPLVLDINVLPTSERQCREVAKLQPEIQTQAWLTSVERANGKVPSARIVKQVVIEIRGGLKMESKPKAKNDIINTPGLGIEYLAYLDEETNRLLEKYQEKIGAATKNGAIRRLLDMENQQER